MNAFVMAFIVTIQAQTFPNPITLATGQGPQGSNDPLWLVSPVIFGVPPGPLTQTYGAALISNACAVGAWIDPATLPPPINNGNWISEASVPCTDPAAQLGYRYFRLTINLPPDCNGNSVSTPGSFTLNLSGYVDNTISDVFINGNSTGFSGGGFAAGTQLNMTLVGPWVPGINYVDVLVYNGGGPYGLLLVANVTANGTADSDGDGVPNYNDLCPCVAGTDAVGCSPLPPPNNCDVALIRSTLIGAGNTELLNMDNTCSLYFINPQFMSGPAAETYAQTFGADLISVQSGTENTDLMNALNNQGYSSQVVWIGYGRSFPGGPFSWYDGSPLGYTNWAAGEPNNSGDEECTQIYPAGTWNDLDCNSYNSLSVIEVNLCPVTTITPSATAICIGQSVTVSANTILGSKPYTYSWTSVPAGFTSAAATFTTSPLVTTVYSVTETDRYGCTSQNSVTITVNVATASITPNGPLAFCPGGNVLLTANNSSSYSWTPAATSQLITAAATGTYSVTITDANGCTATDQITVTVNPAPVADFNSTSVCAGNITQFTDNSSTSSGTITSWNWDFGDVTPVDNTQSPSHTYAAAGMYNATLIAGNSFGCTTTISKPVQVYYIPTANFTSGNVCAGDTMHFINTSSVDASTSLAGYLWTFGGSGGTSTAQDPANYYSTAGIYTVTLLATTSDGCSNVTTIPVTSFDAPASAFTFSNTCLFDSARFINTSTDPTMGSMANWSWDFGDGTAVNTTSWSPAHLYATAGNYTVTLITHSSSLGCPDTTVAAITIYSMPLADFTNTSVCAGNATQFTDNSSSVSGTITSWNWDFGDGTPVITTQNPSHNFAAAGIHTVTLIAGTSFGCTDTISKPVQVYYIPVANFTHGDVCVGDTMYFTNTSTLDPSTSMASYLWAFGDNGATSNLQDPGHYYSNPDNYIVTLVTTTVDGCSGVSNDGVNAFDAPRSAFTFSNTCLYDSARFTNTSANPSMGTIANWSWDFGDGSAVNTSGWSPAHLYATAGNYTVTLITQSSTLGCPDTMIATITIFPMPSADFSFADVCLNQVMNFSDLSTVPIGTVTGWSWDFGDTNPIDNSQNPVHTYLTAGTFNVVLIATSNNGCKDTITKSVIVHPLPTIQFVLSDVCDGTPVQFNDQSTIPATDLLQSWVWSFGDGSVLDNTQNTTHLYSSPGSYNVEHFVFSAFGCIDSLTKTVVVNPNPIVNFTAPNTVGCEPLCVSFQDLSTILTGTNDQFLWNFGDGSATGNSPAPTNCYTSDSVFVPVSSSVTLTVTSDKGCISTFTQNNYILVYPNPVADFNVQPTSTTILTPIITFTNLSTGANFWTWDLGDLTTLSNTDPAPHTYADTGTYVITLITSTQYNCWDTAYQSITIEPDFMFYIPSAFTPNGNGLNDSFSGRGIFIEKYEMSIYDRWGNLVYKTDDINKPWTGKTKGGSEMAEIDVYVYSINVTDIKKNVHYYKGIVSLLK